MSNLIRLILHSDSIKSSDVHTFENAAKTLNLIYKVKYPKDRVVISFVKSGIDIVNAINNIPAGKLISLDIISHGNQSGIHIARKLTIPEKSGILQRNAHVQIRRYTNSPQTDLDAEFIEESVHGLYSGYFSKLAVAYYYNQTFEKSSDTAYLSEINFKVFAENSVIEFHGCRTAEVVPYLNTWMKDNFAEAFSVELGKKGIVIGHITNSAPDKNPNGNANDYRYGLVNVYKDGSLITDSAERSMLRFENSSTPK